MTFCDGRPFALAYAVLGLAVALALALLMPPMMNPDEMAHFARADQISRGGLLAERLDARNAGGTIAAGIGAVNHVFRDISHDNNKVTETLFQEARAATWTGGTVTAQFSNTAVYPPLFYLPSVAGIWAGKALDLEVLTTLYLSRVLTGIAAVALGALALALAGAAAPCLFAVLTLPTALSLSGSTSQEALMNATGALACALAVRLCVGAGSTAVNLYGSAFATMLVVMARPPLIGLALVPLAMAQVPWRQRLAGAAMVTAGTLGWVAMTHGAFVHPRLSLDPAAVPGQYGSAEQIAFVVAHPKQFVVTVITSVRDLGPYWFEAFVGVLGWYDTKVPVWYQRLAAVMLTVAFVASFPGASSLPPRSRVVVLCGLAAVFGAVLAAMYVAWTPVGYGLIDGVQGRYFVAPALFAALLCPAVRLPRRLRRALATATLLFAAAVTAPMVIHLVATRYYLAQNPIRMVQWSDSPFPDAWNGASAEWKAIRDPAQQSCEAPNPLHHSSMRRFAASCCAGSRVPFRFAPRPRERAGGALERVDQSGSCSSRGRVTGANAIWVSEAGPICRRG